MSWVGSLTHPTNEVDIYDPVSNTWSLGVPFPTAGRNFAADTDGTNNIWKAGGYDNVALTIIASMEIFNCPVSPCGSPRPRRRHGTATPTATATPTQRRRLLLPGGRTTPDAAAASHAAASAVRPSLTVVFLRGLAIFASPRIAYFSLRSYS